MKPKNLLLIFTRNPEPGKCKTRLAAFVGDSAALEIYIFLLKHTATITKNLEDTAREVHYSEAIREDDFWDNSRYTKRLQKGNDLGERMANAFKMGFGAGYKKIIIIGSDMYDLSGADLENAFAALDENEFVLGPASDGGYYLLGMRTFYEQLFKEKQWGTETVLSDTMELLQGKKVAILATKNDIDVYEDIENIDVFQPFIKHLKNDKGTT